MKMKSISTINNAGEREGNKLKQSKRSEAVYLLQAKASAAQASELRGLKLINKQIAFCKMLAAFNVYHYHSGVSQQR
jgi:hypothetical protein